MLRRTQDGLAIGIAFALLAVLLVGGNSLWSPKSSRSPSPSPSRSDTASARVPVPASPPAPSAPRNEAEPIRLAEPLPSATVEVLVYVTASGKKYHRVGCRHLKSINAVPLAEAFASYSPCSVCSPPVPGVGVASAPPGNLPRARPAPPSAERGSSMSVQCAGTTKKGAQCRRMTRDPSGYCYQHD